MEIKTLKTLEYNKITKMLGECAVNTVAKELAEAITPSSDYEEVNAMLNETDAALILLLRFGSPDISRVNEVSSSLKRIEIGGSLGTAELLNIAKVLKTARSLKKYYREQAEGTLDGYFEMLTPNKQVEDLISSSILSEEEIADNASTELASIRRKIKNASAKVKETLNSLIHSAKYQKFLQDAIVTMRNDRYVVPVKAEYKGEVSGIVHDVSSSGSTLFIEPTGVVNANNELNELAIKEKHEIERILFELTSYVAEISETVSYNFDSIIKIDFIFAKAKLANHMKAVRPILSKQCQIDIKKGRHPLLNPQTVVPTDIKLGLEFDSLIVTGPNTGGKTVVLKTVGLFALMTQSGLHIPAADDSVMCVFDNIFADIGDEQSIEQSLSTFSSHMKNIVSILDNVTPGSLVLLDELGAGTDPVEGAALATAILDYIKAFGAKTVATTHYSELKLYALSSPRVENASCEFDVNTLSPTYRLLIGIPGKSNAFLISQRLGLSDHIISKAQGMLGEENVKFEDILGNIEKNRQTSEREREEAQNLRTEIERLKQELENKKEALEKERDKVINKAQEEAREIIKNAKYETDELIKRITNAQKQKDEQSVRKAMEEVKRELNIKSKQSSQSSNKKPASPSNININTLKPGTTVIIFELDEKGTVVSVNTKDKTALVQVGIMKTTCKINELALAADETTANMTRFSSGKSVNVRSDRKTKTELDLRGMNLDEALLETDKFLDDSVMSSLNQVTIIHGKGTGVLRSGISDFLTRHKHVKTHRLGKYGEGEQGVTIVELK